MSDDLYKVTLRVEGQEVAQSHGVDIDLAKWSTVHVRLEPHHPEMTAVWLDVRIQKMTDEEKQRDLEEQTARAIPPAYTEHIGRYLTD